MNARSLLFAAALLAGCSDDTGILVEVHGERLELAVKRLDTMVILDDGTAVAPDQAAWGIADNRQDTVENVDLRAEPYTVLLRPDGVATDATLWVAAIAYDGAGNVIGFGQLDTMIGFAPDVVLRVQLDLEPAEMQTAGEGGCVVSNGAVVVRTTDDCDGDQSPYTEDCDDLDPLVVSDLDGDPAVCHDDCDPSNGEVYPEASEVCDGFDNDCNADTLAAPELCVAVTTEASTGDVVSCTIGQRDCLDMNPDAPFDEQCRGVNIDAVANGEVCGSWAECGPDPTLECLVDATVYCKLKHGTSGVCTQNTTNLHELASSATVCGWRLIGSLTGNGWTVGLRPPGGDTLVSFSDACDTQLVVAQGPSLVRPKLVVLEANLDGVYSLVSVLLDPKRSDCSPGENVPLECFITSGEL